MTASNRRADRGPVPDATGMIRAEYDWSSQSLSLVVTETVAVASDREPTALGSLHKTVDPDALETLLDSSGLRSTDEVIIALFVFAGHSVTIQNDEAIVSQPGESRHESG